MTHHPLTVQELTETLIDASARGEKGLVFKLDSLNRVLEHNPADMTVTVETGITLAALQERLAQSAQWLPIDPTPLLASTISDILNLNSSGPHRFGYGTIREHLLGLTVVLADGRLIHNGGKVVKNVAGYDLCKLFVGSRNSLGVMVEATFKVRPLPEAQQIVSASFDSLSRSALVLEAIHASELTPVVLDLHNPDRGPLPDGGRSDDYWVVLGFEGAREDVAWQLNKAAELGLTTATTLDYEAAFWTKLEASPVHCLSTLPSRMTEALEGLGASEFVARAGNGVIYYRGGKAAAAPEWPKTLTTRVKEAYDSRNVFPALLNAE